MTLSASLQNYAEVTKPKIWSLLVFTAFGGLVVGSGGPPSLGLTLLVLTAVTLGSAAANTLTNYIDRDIDEVMNRTRLRPLPSRRIYPAKKALWFGMALTVLALAASLFINLLAFILMTIGILDNVIVYSRVLKRRNPVSIILGGFSGGMPVLIGYGAVANAVTLASLTMAALVVLWIPTHIWSLSLHFKDDYARARVPMLPVVTSESVAIRCIASTSILLVVFSLLPYLLSAGPAFGGVYLAFAAILGGVMLAASFWLISRPSAERAWVVFKLSSPYLALLFIGMMINAVLG